MAVPVALNLHGEMIALLMNKKLEMIQSKAVSP